MKIRERGRKSSPCNIPDRKETVAVTGGCGEWLSPSIIWASI